MGGGESNDDLRALKLITEVAETCRDDHKAWGTKIKWRERVHSRKGRLLEYSQLRKRRREERTEKKRGKGDEIPSGTAERVNVAEFLEGWWSSQEIVLKGEEGGFWWGKPIRSESGV